MRLRRIQPDLLCEESRQSQMNARRCTPARVARFGARRHILPIGDGDDYEFYMTDETDAIYCVSINTRHDYCGIQAFDPSDQEADPTLGLFFQGDQVDETLGRDALARLTHRTIARRLIAYFQEVCV